MYTFEIDFETQVKVQDLLMSKDGICEYMPKVRITNLESRGGISLSLVCVHPDSSLNCGTGAEYCTNCKDKERVYKSNAEFSKFLSEKGTDIIKLINL